MDYFANSLQHLFAELERIDLLIAAHVSRARRLHAEDEQFHGLYISEEEVDASSTALGSPRWATSQNETISYLCSLIILRNRFA